MTRVITGEWDGQPIWREQTTEERLLEEKIEPKVANLYIALNEHE
jgi:hypothetical protein